MSEHEQRALAEAYALSALDDAEKKAFEEHLTTCKECRAAVRAATPTTAAVGLTAPREKPPKGSGDRLVALYRQERGTTAGPGGSSRGTTLATLFGLIALGLVGWGVHERERAREAEKKLDEAEKKLDEAEKKLDRCHDERKILEDPQLQELSLVPYSKRPVPFPVSVKIKYSVKGGVAIIGNDLPDPGPGKCYKLWSIAGADVKPMRSFGPGVNFDRSPGGASTKFAISIEDAPGDVEHGTDVVLVPPA